MQEAQPRERERHGPVVGGRQREQPALVAHGAHVVDPLREELPRERERAVELREDGGARAADGGGHGVVDVVVVVEASGVGLGGQPAQL